MSPWTCTQYHNMYTHKVRFHQDYPHMDRSFACYIFHNQLRGAICCITLSNIPSSHGALAMHISIIYLWFVMCWFCKIYKSKPGRLPVTGCGKAFWNRLVHTCRLLPKSKENLAAHRFCFDYLFSQIFKQTHHTIACDGRNSFAPTNVAYIQIDSDSSSQTCCL